MEPLINKGIFRRLERKMKMTMKQIFDWLREQMSKLHKKNPYDSYWEHDKYLMENVVIAERDETIKKVRELINEAEAKWESDCCIWKLEENTGIAWHCADGKCSTYNSSYIKNLRIVLEDFDCICPHCGKPIKISEVE